MDSVLPELGRLEGDGRVRGDGRERKAIESKEVEAGISSELGPNSFNQPEDTARLSIFSELDGATDYIIVAYSPEVGLDLCGRKERQLEVVKLGGGVGGGGV